MHWMTKPSQRSFTARQHLAAVGLQPIHVGIQYDVGQWPMLIFAVIVVGGKLHMIWCVHVIDDILHIIPVGLHAKAR